jgi:hypothetical protein
MHGFILDTVINADHETTHNLAMRVARLLAQHDDVKNINVAIRCNADPDDDDASILD